MVRVLPVTSSNLRSVAFNPDTKSLMVAFKGQKGKGGLAYVFSDVDRRTFEDLLQATSKGVFFNANIKDKYPCVKCASEEEGALQVGVDIQTYEPTPIQQTVQAVLIRLRDAIRNDVFHQDLFSF